MSLICFYSIQGGGESLEQLYIRAQSAMEEIAEKHHGMSSSTTCHVWELQPSSSGSRNRQEIYFFETSIEDLNMSNDDDEEEGKGTLQGNEWLSWVMVGYWDHYT